MLKLGLGRALAGVFALGILAATGLSALAGEKPMIVRGLTCPFGCGGVAQQVIFSAQLGRNSEKLMFAPQETPGYMYNVRAMANKKYWKNTMFGSEDAIVQLALQGGRPELKEFLPEPVPIKFQMLYNEAIPFHGKFWVTFQDDIKNAADLKGKRVSLGLRGQSDWGVFPRLFLKHGYGITPDNTDLRHMPPSGITQQLIDRATDAGITPFITNANRDVWFKPGPLRQLEATGRTMYWVGVNQNAVDSINKLFGTTFWLEKIPAGTLKDQKEDVTFAAERANQMVHPDFDEKMAYEVVMMVAKYGPKMRDLKGGLWVLWSPKNMMDGMTEENTHPGAIRAYKELGWWDKHRGGVPMTYPEPYKG